MAGFLGRFGGAELTTEQTCPACGKPTGGYVPCPHCGADPRVRFSMKQVMMLCMLILGIGILYFFIHTATLQAKALAISDIDEWQNYASVWIEGTVVTGPQMDNRSVAFEVMDASGGGPIKVTIYYPPSALKAQDKIPLVGDNVKVFGMLRVFLDGTVEIRVSSLGFAAFTGEDKFQVTPSTSISTNVEDVVNKWKENDSLKYKRITLEGTVIDMRVLSSAKIYTLEGTENTVEVYVHNGLVYLGDNTTDLKLLQKVRVTAGASEYSGTPQLAIADPAHIEILEEGTPIDVTIENVNENHRKQFVKTGGQIIFVELGGEETNLQVKKRYFWLNDNDNPRVWLWESVYSLLSDNAKKLLKIGSAAELTGRVSSSGRLEIELAGPPEISLTEGTYEPTFVENHSEIVGDNVGDFVTIQGQVTNFENIGTAVVVPYDRKLTLTDNSGGTAAVWISPTIYERMVDPSNLGDTVRVVGKVYDYFGEIQVRPGVPGDVVKVS